MKIAMGSVGVETDTMTVDMDEMAVAVVADPPIIDPHRVVVQGTVTIHVVVTAVLMIMDDISDDIQGHDHVRSHQFLAAHEETVTAAEETAMVLIEETCRVHHRLHQEDHVHHHLVNNHHALTCIVKNKKQR